MPVVINEFRAEVEPAPASASSAAAPEPAGEAAPPAIDIEQIERFLDERALRVWAH